MLERIKQKAYTILDTSDNETLLSRLLNVFLIILICLNVFAVCLETVDEYYSQHLLLFHRFEVFSITIFSIEFLLRVWAITSNERFKNPILGRLKFLFTFNSMVDLIAILPFYLPMIIGFDFRIVRLFRLFRLIRVLKISRYMNATKMIAKVFKTKKEELGISMLLIAFLIIIISSIMFHVEHDAQPDKFSSIPATMWWSVATLTTVGYGDIYPITILGKTLASIISILSIGMVALPAGILASGFSEELKKRNENDGKYCPHCGKNIESFT